ncbi:MAG: hypothetical protein Q9220_004166 [cf. Caloplaca sp. 1 TL-2023]
MTSSSVLASKFAASLPSPHRFTIHHLSTPPTPSPAIFSAPPGQKPERTNCASHVLTVSITHGTDLIQVFALEILIYTTAHLTTLFVSKADSTGYLHLLQLPRGTPSPLKTISSVFLSHLVALHRRPDRPLVVSLFARAQDQYLFPGSIENERKHVLDDRGLIRWWCRVLEPVLHPPPPLHDSNNTYDDTPSTPSPNFYLRVPGCDIHETRSFFPARIRRSPSLLSHWHPSKDPLTFLSRSPTYPPERCLIPRFPDDPKSRFVDELDDELTEPPPTSQTTASPSKGKRPGKWRSVGSLEQFWELMAFRQECASGRLVGFLWGVWGGDHGGSSSAVPFRMPTTTPLPAGIDSQLQESRGVPLSATTPPPQPKHELPSLQPSSPKNPSLPTKQPPPPTNPPPPRPASGAIILPQKHYARCARLLLHLDYADLSIAIESSRRWTQDVAMCAGVQSWGWEVQGLKENSIEERAGERVEGKEEGVNVLGVRKKKREDDGLGEGEGVNVLGAGLVRKKVKVR